MTGTPRAAPTSPSPLPTAAARRARRSRRAPRCRASPTSKRAGFGFAGLRGLLGAYPDVGGSVRQLVGRTHVDQADAGRLGELLQPVRGGADHDGEDDRSGWGDAIDQGREPLYI